MLLFKDGVCRALRYQERFSDILKSQLDNIFQEGECLGIWHILKIFPNKLNLVLKYGINVPTTSSVTDF